jgi:hypothetical protein
VPAIENGQGVIHMSCRSANPAHLTRELDTHDESPRPGRLRPAEDLNFLLTNRVPRIALTRFMGWFSQIRSPLLARVSIAVWRLFTTWT